MQYLLIQFTLGLNCQGYQEIENGEAVRYTDLDGNTLDLPAITESYVVSGEYVTPEWAA